MKVNNEYKEIVSIVITELQKRNIIKLQLTFFINKGGGYNGSKINL